jgi:ribosome maturation factor RimP
MGRRALATVEALAGKAAAHAGVELVDLEYSPSRGNSVLRLFIDKEGGITVDDCTRVSRAMSDALETEDPIRGSYRLEVSSPGINRALKSERDFVRFQGYSAHIVLRRPVQGQRTISGTVQRCEEGAVTLKTASTDEFRVELENISRARLDVDPWEQAKAKGKRKHAG